MARLALEPVLREFYGKKDNLQLKRASQRKPSSRKAAKAFEEDVASSDGDDVIADDILDEEGEQEHAAGSESEDDADDGDSSGSARDDGAEAPMSHGDDDELGSDGSPRDSADALDSDGPLDSESDGSEEYSSDGASDLEGLPLASVLEGAEEEEAKQKSKKRQKPVAQPITAEGAQADKLGLAFQRILQKDAKAANVLAGSKSLQKRKREEADEDEAAKKRRVKRLEMKQRGHISVLGKGQDPEADAREKQYTKTATRAVVQLFNAISQAQKSQREAQEAGVKDKDAVKQTKAALLQVLKPDKASEGVSKTQGWKVLQEGFTGTEAGGKMKDWGKELEQEEDAQDEMPDGADSDQDFDDW